MKLIKNKIWFAPTDLSQFYASPFASWMKHYQLQNPHEKFEVVSDPTMELLAKRGNEHELKYLDYLKSENKNIIEINKNGNVEQAAIDTINALKAGPDIIYQGAFIKDNFSGYSDFLIKVTTPSKLGNYSYEVLDTKLALSAKPEYILQLSCYSEMLADLQGKSPENISIVLGDNSKVDFRIENFKSYYGKFKKDFLKYHDKFDPKNRPLPQAWENLGDWEEIGQAMLKEIDHLSLVAGMGPVQIKKFELAGINTAEQLANATTAQMPEKMQKATFAKLNRQAFLQKLTEKTGLPQYELRKLDTVQPYGLEKLPLEDSSDVYFDMEGFPLVDKGLEYLFGAVIEEEGEIRFKDWWALNKAEEKIAFENWIDWVFARYKKNPQMHIYHYAAYEVTAMKKLMGEHMTREYEVDELLRNSVFVDLYQVVSEGLIVGAPSYSIKKLENLYDFKRSADVKQAGDSVVQFANWLELKDGADHKTSKILKEIRDYNEEDCISTIKLTKWLRGVQQKHKIEFKLPTTESYVATEKTKADELMNKLEGLSPADKAEAEVHKLLKAALGYHKRERNPQWWFHFERVIKLPEELFDDMECLANCVVLSKEGKKVKIQFDPEQETKIRENSKLCLHNDYKVKATVDEINYQNATVILNVSKKAVLPNEFTLIPDGPIKTDAIEESIFVTAEEWFKHKDLTKLRPALRDLLTKANPRFTDKRLLIHNKNMADPGFMTELIQACKNLDQSVLAIQGPPGTGKTYTASHLIAELLIDKKKIGVVSNTHKAINLLMQKAHEVLVERKLRDKFIFYKSQNEKDEEFLKTTKTIPAGSAKDFFGSEDCRFDLVGGTSWFFSAVDAVDKFDYLFIEEAGQFALANAIASQSSAKNLVLLGDQMQLEQPIQGTHPDEIAESALGHYLKDIAAVTPDKGIFLGQSRRMHQDVCSFISEMVYESQLESHEDTLFNKIEITDSKHIKKQTGLIFVPVQHEGNSQGSDEEIEVIQQIVKELSRAKIFRKNVTENFSLKNCLFVAPYNLQVGKIKSALGDAVKAGSVDLFQGQEADIVILSMCSSDGEVSPRGLDFLLNKNRMNVAISRAKSLAIVVGSEKLVESRAKTIKSMALLNLFCRLIEVG